MVGSIIYRPPRQVNLPTRFNRAYERAEGQSADEVFSVLPPLAAIAGRINFALGDGLDAVAIRDEIGTHFLAADETNASWQSARRKDYPELVPIRSHD